MPKARNNLKWSSRGITELSWLQIVRPLTLRCFEHNITTSSVEFIVRSRVSRRYEMLHTAEDAEVIDV